MIAGNCTALGVRWALLHVVRRVFVKRSTSVPKSLVITTRLNGDTAAPLPQDPRHSAKHGSLQAGARCCRPMGVLFKQVRAEQPVHRTPIRLDCFGRPHDTCRNFGRHTLSTPRSTSLAIKYTRAASARPTALTMGN